MRPTAILFIAVLLLAPCLAQADISPWISYQGVLRDGSGTLVPDGIYTVVFNIYTVQTGGTSLWVEGHTLTATDGIINAYLGSIEPLNTLAFDVPYWLGIAVDGEAQLAPRTPFTTVPYAGHAGYADTCLEGDEDWAIDGDDVYHDVGNVGIGTATPDVTLDVFTANAPCARFENNSGNYNFTVRGVNNSGTAGGFFSGTPPLSSPLTPAAVYGVGGPASRGAHFSSEGSDALFAYSADAVALWGRSGANYAGYFDGGGLGVYVDDLLETNGFMMQPGAASGYVLTSDASGNGTWQSGSGGSDGDWTINGSDMYSTPAGNVGIGESTPTAKLEIETTGSTEALYVKHNGLSLRTCNIARETTPGGNNDILQITATADAPDNFQFIECQRGSALEFLVNGNGQVVSNGGGEFSSTILSASVPVLSGVSDAAGSADVVGVYGESVPVAGYGIGGSFVGGYRGVMGSVNPTGSGNFRGVYGQVTGGTGYNYAVYGYADGGASNYGVYGGVTGLGYAGYFGGNAHVTGTLTAGVKSFKIDHPLDPENKYLLHSCVESDDMMNIYNGNVTLDARGEAVVEMPEWFEALNQDFRYQLTAIGAPGPNLYVAEEVSGNHFMVAGGDPGMKISWQVTGVRHDPLATASRVLVEQDKPADEVGKYMHPEAYGMPVTAGVDYREEREIPRRASSREGTNRAERNSSDGD